MQSPFDEIAELGDGEHELEDKSTMIAEIVGSVADEETLQKEA